MSLEQQMKSGLLYREFGHKDEKDVAYEKLIERQRKHGKELTFAYNQTNPSDYGRKRELLEQILGSLGDEVWIESPVNFSYGCNTHVGNYFYANFNLVIVDDVDVYIGDYVMCGPNVSICVTGHPVYGEFRRDGTQFSLPVHIGNDVWIGANAVIMPGVTIGNNVVIGAGSVVTQDIPDNVVAFGTPCRVARPITEEDKEYFRKGVPVNKDWRE